MRLSILDFGFLPGIAEYAIQADELGYTRFWISEHHSSSVYTPCPEVLIPFIAGLTANLRVGAAGILLGMYRPFKVAEVFHTISALFPGRVDLGCARGVVERATRSVLASDTETPYEARLEELAAYIRDPVPKRAPRSGLTYSSAAPDVWVLGSKKTSASLAAAFGLSYAHSIFFRDSEVHSTPVQPYRSMFVPSTERAKPEAVVSVALACASSESAARALAGSTPLEFIVPRVVGTPAQCAAQLAEIAHCFDVDELVVFDIAREPEARVETLFALASEMGLKPKGED